jgi:uncharacterized protein YjiS (DUF1127 family)
METTMIASLPRVYAPQQDRQRLVAGFVGKVGHEIALWWRTRRDRRALAALSDTMLQDVGLTRADVEREMVQPFWQPIDYRSLDEQRALAARAHPKGRARL